MLKKKNQFCLVPFKATPSDIHEPDQDKNKDEALEAPKQSAFFLKAQAALAKTQETQNLAKDLDSSLKFG